MADGNDKHLAGSGGGKSGGRKPVEAPNTLHSIASAQVLDLVSEGPIVGFATPNPLESVYLDETPLANPDGSLNFKDVHVEYRFGTQDQEYIKGFPSVENEIMAGVTLRPDVPFVRSITNTELSAVRVRISVPGLSRVDEDTNDVVGHRINYAIDLADEIGGAYQNVLHTSFNGKTTSTYARSHRIDLPPTTSGWMLRVRRLTPQEDSAVVNDTTVVEATTEIIDAKLRYPNSALVGIKVNAEQFPGIPRRAFDLVGRIVRVPSNYDPIARTYDGIWDGTFKPEWTDNPAWIYYDAILNPRYGLGHRISEFQVDRWALYRIARICDELVPDGRGGLEPRYTCNIFIQQQIEAYRLLRDLASVFNGIAYYADNRIVAAIDAPSDAVVAYTNADVLEGRFTYTGSGKSTRATVALVTWYDPDDFYRPKIEPVVDDAGVARYGIEQIELIAAGCASQGQAQRAGWWALLTGRLETEGVSFSLGLNGTFAMPGQIIKIADAKRAGRRIGGRIVESTTNSVTVDAMPEVTPAVGDHLSAMLPSGLVQKRAITAVSGSTLTTEPFDAMPTVGGPWVLETDALAASTWRVVSVTEAPGEGDGTDGMTFSISAVEHAPEKFAAIDGGVLIEGPPTTQVPGNVQLAPASVTLTAVERAGRVVTSPTLNVAWPQTPGAVRYGVAYRRSDGEWTDLPGTTATNTTVENVFAGTYIAQVWAYNAAGIVSGRTTSAPLEVADQTLPPGVVTDIQDDVGAAWEALQQEVTDRLAGDAAEAIARAAAIADEAAARAADLAAEAAARADDIAAEAQARADADAAEEQARAAAIAAEAQARADDIAAEAQNRADAIDDEAQARADAIAAEAALRSAADAAEASARASAIADEAAARVAALQDLSDNLWGTIDALGAQMADIMEADEHDPALAYPNPGDLVQSDGKLYRSLQPVPTGIAITDEAYWQYMGDYASLGEAVAATVSRVNVLTTSVTALDGEIEAINTLVTDLQSGLGDAEGNIAANAGLISALGTRVTETEGLLEAVAEDITGLTTAIEGKADASALNALTVRVTETEDSLESVVQDITDLEATIPDLATVAALDTLTTRVTENEDGIEAVTTDLTALTAVVDDKASAGAVSDLTVRVTETEDAIESVATDLTALETVVDGKASAGAVSALETRVTETESGIDALSTDITNLETVLDGKASSAALAALTTRVTEAEGEISTMASDIVDLGTELDGKASTGALSALDVRVTENEAGIEAVASDITDLNTALDGKASTGALQALETRVTENEDGIEAVATDLTNLTTVVDGKASAGAVSLLETRVEANEDGISTLSTDVTNLTTVVDGKASTGALNALETRVTETEDGLEAVSTDITDLTAVVDGKASTGALQALETRVTDNEDGIEAVSTDLTALTTVVDGKASTGAVTALETRVTDTEAGIEAVSTDLTALETVVDGKASTGAVTALETRVTENETGIEAVTTDLTNLTTVVDGKASTAALNSLTTRVDENEDGIEAVATDVAALEAALPGLATVGALDLLTTRVTDNEDGIEAVASDITQLNTDLEGKASTAALDLLTTRVTETEGAIEAVGEDITQINIDLDGKASTGALTVLSGRVDATEDGIDAVVEDITQLNTDLDGKASTAALTTLAGRVSTNEGAIEAVVEDITDLNTELDGKASAGALDALTVTVSEQADGIAANVTDISTMRASIGRPSSIVRKGTFEDGTTGMWSSGEAIAVGDHPSLSHALRVPPSITSYEGTTPDAVPVTPGDIVDVAVDASATGSTGNSLVLVHWIRADNSNAGFSTVATLKGGIVGWQLGVGGATSPAPEGTARARIGLSGGTSGYTFYNNVRATIRTAADALIDARVTTVDSASVDRDEALGTRVGVVESRMPAGSGPLATNAQIVTEQQARASAVGAVASDLAALSIDVGEQSASITQLSTVTGSISAVIIHDPSFELRDGSWTLGPNTSYTYSGNAARTGNYYIDYAAGVGTRTSTNAGRFRVEAGQQIRLWQWLRYATAVPLGVGPTIGVAFFDEAGTNLNANQNIGAFPLSSLTTSWKKHEGIITVPPNAAYGEVYAAGRHTTPANARVLVDDIGGEFVTEGEAKFLASHSVALDVNGYITGWVLHNDGSTGAFDVRADRFSITNPSGGAGTVFSDGNWRVYDANGVLRVRMGVW